MRSLRTAGRSAALIAVLLCAAPVARAADEAPGEALDYIEVVTADAEADAPLPMIVAVHGLGDRPESFQLLFARLDVAARVILPRGPVGYGEDGYSWFPMRRGSGDDDGFVRGVRQSAGRVASLVATLVAKRPTVGKPVVTGFSQGGIMSFALATLHPETVAAAVPVAGFLPQELWPEPTATVQPQAGLPMVLALHGEKDGVIPLDRARWTVEVLKTRGYKAELRSYPNVSHTVSRDMRHDLLNALAAAAEEPAPVAPDSEAPDPEASDPAGAGSAGLSGELRAVVADRR